MPKKVAIIEDEAELAALLEYNLGRQGLTTRVISSSKGALEQLTRCYRMELGARGITINTVLPGFVETELAADTPQEYKDNLMRRTALGRLGTPEEIASVVAFLASDAARWITGEAIQVSGGLA